MARTYPKLGVTLRGEPGDVRRLADSLETFVRRMDAVPDKGMQVDQCFSGGNTRHRALEAVLKMNDRINGSVASIGNSSSHLHVWAGHIEETRDKLDSMQRDVIDKERERARKEAELHAIPKDGTGLRGSEDAARVRLRNRIESEIRELTNDIDGIRTRAGEAHDDYVDKAKATGEALRRASLSAPGVPQSYRNARDLLRIADDLNKVTLPLSLIGGLAGAGGRKVGSEALKRLAKLLGRAGAGSSAAQLSSKALADLAGADVHWIDYVATAGGLSKGIADEVLNNKYVDGPLEVGSGASGQFAKEHPARAPHPRRRVDL